METLWRNKNAVITGANSGMGYEMLKKLAEHGITVVCFDISLDNIKKLQSEMKNAKIHCFECDVTKDDSAEAAFEWVEKNLGGTDILVNNAGCIRPIGCLEYEKSMNDLAFSIDLNFTAVIRCSRLAFKSMQARDTYGYIININSVYGHFVAPLSDNIQLGVYPGTKHGISASTEVMRMELNLLKNRKVRVTSVSPGVVATNLFKNAHMSAADIQEIYENPTLRPQAIADVIFYLLTVPYEVNIADITVRATGAAL